jgi:hypothetical protein
MRMKFRLPTTWDVSILKRINVNIHAPWSVQCRKFDAHIAFYPVPMWTFSIGLTLPFFFCLYVSIGLKSEWWDRRIGPTLNRATFGAWVFAGTMMVSYSIKAGGWRDEGVKAFGGFKERRQK